MSSTSTGTMRLSRNSALVEFMFSNDRWQHRQPVAKNYNWKLSNTVTTNSDRWCSLCFWVIFSCSSFVKVTFDVIYIIICIFVGTDVWQFQSDCSPVTQDTQPLRRDMWQFYFLCGCVHARVRTFDYCLNIPVNIYSTLLVDNSLTNLLVYNIKCSGELYYEHMSKRPGGLALCWCTCAKNDVFAIKLGRGDL